MTIAPEIFKAYDIRGIVDKTLTEEAAEKIGRGLAAMGKAKGVKRFVVGRDGRLSGPRLCAALAKGLSTLDGHLVYAPVADAHGLPYTDPASLLAGR